ncbi:MAG: beta-ketoacyl-[acyl-carrier-protein] synthase family protein [Bacteroidales bacterium]|nr:beta-ketoacyl-[acyl-carrier-protein] synthase family protein [Candidatus Egerieousia equi]
MRIAISGIGIISALGAGASRTIEALSAARSGISSSTAIVSSHLELPAGEIPLTNEQLALKLGIDGKRIISRTALLGAIAASEALDNARCGKDRRIALISGTSIGGMDLTELFEKDSGKGPFSRLRYVRMHDCASSTRFIADHCGITGYTSTISTACSSAMNAIIAGARLIRHNIADTVIAGGTDALSLFTLNGFNSLGILDCNVCRPFDRNRNGLNLGEAAAYLVLQREDVLDSDPYCYLEGWGNANDAYHQTASSPNGDGAYMAMKKALETSGLETGRIDAIIAHGTGTPNNDAAETQAFVNLFGSNIPPFISTKAYTGHTLAASGSLNAVIACLCIKHGFLPASLNFNNPMDEGLPVPQSTFNNKIRIRNMLTNAFGFGGNCSSIILSAQ